MSALSSFRRSLMFGKSRQLPYDSEVWYLEGTGTQYINTGFRPNQDTRVVCEFMQKTNKPNSAPFGSESPRFSVYILSSKLRFDYNTTMTTSNVNVANGKVYNVDFNKNSVSVDGTQVISFDYSTFTAPELYIFRTHYGSSYFYGRIYSCKIYDNGILIRDYIPVRVGNVGYFYDKVGGQLYGNSGSGSFVVGDDVPTSYDSEIEYIESTGTQYISTEVINTTNTEFEIMFQLTDSTGDRKMIGQISNFGMGQLDNYWRILDNITYKTSVPTDINKHTVHTEFGKYYLDSTLLADRLSQKVNGSFPMLLFAASNTNNALPNGYAKMKLYSCKIYENGILIRNFIPVRSGIKGYLYDSIEEKFYMNSGTDNFILGNDIN